MKILFQSKLFFRIFVSMAVVITVVFAIMYFLSVPFIQNTVEGIEQYTARTILKNVYEMVEQTDLELENYRKSILAERKTQLRNIITVVEGRIKALEIGIQAGELTRQEAKQQLLDELRYFKYGRDDYVWAASYDAVLISHPDPQLHNTDFSKRTDVRGNLIVPPMITGAQTNGEGYYSYWWRRLGEEEPIEKLSYYKHIPDFDLVIGTGMYMDDVESTVHLKKSLAIEELRQRLKSTRLAKSGYVYIFDGQMNMIIHPTASLEGKNVATLINPSTQTPILPQLIAATDTDTGLHYLWDRPTDPAHYIFEKMSWVRHYKEFDWYICTSVYVDELDESANTLRKRVVTVFAATMFFTVLLSYLFAKRLTFPLRQLSKTARQVENGDLNARCQVQRSDEIGVVATAFNRMVGHLQENINHLDTKVNERTEELQRLNKKLEELSMTDGLTGVANRHNFDKALGREWKRARRAGEHLALAMIDVDWFKKYNDHYGHLAGDACLQVVAGLIAANVHRSGDIVARYGGEEFIIIAPATNAIKAGDMAVKICETLQAQSIPHAMSEFGCVTISIGVAAMIPTDDDTPESLIKAADTALYNAKWQGRNQVVLAQ